MDTLVKRRGPRVGPTHRVYVTLAQPTFEALRAQSAMVGYSVSALAQKVIDRGVAAGLLDAGHPKPTRSRRRERHPNGTVLPALRET